MANTVKLKQSSVASKVPLTTDLQLGELAVNTYDGKLYLKKDNGTASIVEIGAGGSAITMEGITIPVHTSTPTAPAADNLKIFAKEIANRAMPAFIGPSGLDVTIMPHLARNGFMMARPTHSGNTMQQLGVNLSAVGTFTAATVSTASFHQQFTRIDALVTTAATTAISGFRTAQANTFFRGNASGRGGFHMICRCAPATGGTVATRRFFVGMCGTSGGTAPTDVNPSTLLNIAGVGYDSADTNWQLMFNDGTGTASKVDTGFARPSTDRPDPVEISVFCAPNGSTVYAEIIRLADGTHYMGSEATDIPSNTTLLSPRGYHSVGGTSSVVGFALMGLYCESDN